MASSSSSRLWKYDVFLSFRGADTREKFVSHLHSELLRKGIVTFKDDRKLETGGSISDELPKAIKESKFAIVVISENYASSRWCLDELEMIIERKQEEKLTVIPIFYEVVPADVRYQKGSFADALKKHEDRGTADGKIQKWRDALAAVASISGVDSRTRPDEAAMVKEIVRYLSNRLFSALPKETSGLVGMDSHFEAMVPLLDIKSGDDDGVRMIGICGMGGIGKTMIAKCLYHRFSSQFQSRCFLEDVKSVALRHGPSHLQERLLSKILGEEDLNLDSMEFGFEPVRARLGHQKVFVVLDNVDNIDQLLVLAKESNWFGPGSRIVITTRDKGLLNSHGVKFVYKVKYLGENDAFQLFKQFAFKESRSLHGFEQLSVCASKLAGGLPLALKVFGSFLCGRNKEEWEGAMCKLKRDPREVMEVLKVSYDGLDELDKDVFLLIACFVNQEEVSHVKRILDDRESEMEVRIKVLAEKSLIDISPDGYIRVHDLLQQMSKELIRQQEPGKRKILLDAEEIYDLLSSNTGTEAVQGILLDMSKISELSLSSRTFQKMHNLKFLVLQGHLGHKEARLRLTAGPSCLPYKLRLLHWDKYPLETLPSGFWPAYLVKLDLPGSDLKKLWEGIQPLGNLKWMNLRSSTKLEEIPDLTKATNLENLNLSWCASLVGLSSSIRSLNKLSKLSMVHCESLEHLPADIDLKSLEFLNLHGCRRLRCFPKISRSIRKLILCMTAIEEMPKSVTHLPNLELLDMSSCTRLTYIQSTIGNLTALRSLSLQGCTKLRNIPSTIGNLTALQILDLNRCVSLRNIPSSVGNLSALQKLWAQDCKKLESIPSTICQLTCLERVYFGGCNSSLSTPNVIQNLKCLRELKADGSINVMEFPYLVGNVETLWLRRAREQTDRASLPISHLTSLDVLYLRRNHYARDGVPFQCHHLSIFLGLRYLTLRNLNMLQVPDGISRLSVLQNLDLSGNNFETVPSSIMELSMLKVLNLKNCEKLASLPVLLQLERLCVNNCKKLGPLLGLIHMTCLRELDLSGHDFETVPVSLKQLSMLYILRLNECKKLRSLPELPQSLHRLYAHGCTSLDELPYAFDRSLYHLALSGCLKLDQGAQIAQRMAYGLTEEGKPTFACVRGSEVPECFHDQTTGHSLSIHLPRVCHVSEFLGFACCAIVAYKGPHNINDLQVWCRLSFNGNHTGETYSYFEEKRVFDAEENNVESDHMFLLQHPFIGSQLEASKEVSFEFYLTDRQRRPLSFCEVKACGARLMFTGEVEKEFQGDIDKELDSADSSSYYTCTDEEESKDVSSDE